MTLLEERSRRMGEMDMVRQAAVYVSIWVRRLALMNISYLNGENYMIVKKL
jgi:hypothetical protein